MAARAGVNAIEITGFDELAYNGWKSVFERELRGLDAKVQPRVLDKDLNAPPASPTNGDTYIVGSTPTGAWAGKAGQIARWNTYGSAWEFWPPKSGWKVFVVDEAAEYRHNGTIWVIEEKISQSEKGAANGVAPLDASSKVPAEYLPSYVDDVVEYANLASFPTTGVVGIIYVALDTNRIYRWSGSTYFEISVAPTLASLGGVGGRGAGAAGRVAWWGNTTEATSDAGLHTSQVGGKTVYLNVGDGTIDTTIGHNLNAKAGKFAVRRIQVEGVNRWYDGIKDTLHWFVRCMTADGAAVIDDPIVVPPTAGSEIEIGGQGTTPRSVKLTGGGRFGADAPVVKMKKLTGTFNSALGGNTLVTHGLDWEKIIDVSVCGQTVIAIRLNANARGSGNAVFGAYWNSTQIVVENHITDSADILGQTFTILITYEA